MNFRNKAVKAAAAAGLILTMGTGVAFASIGNATVTADSLRLRSEANTASSTITMAPKGTEVTVEESDRGAKRRESTKHMAPDVGAQTLWLKNRRPDKWREKPREDAGAAGDESGVVLLPPVEGEP